MKKVLFVVNTTSETVYDCKQIEDRVREAIKQVDEGNIGVVALPANYTLSTLDLTEDDDCECGDCNCDDDAEY